jgi:RNA polymerase sigma-70 factor (ECF subfamily)
VSTTEHDLVRRARIDPEAFGELYRLHVERVYNYILHRVGTVADAEDLTARTFYRALAGMPGYQDRGAPFSAWLFRIAHNLVANWHRDRQRRATVPLEEVTLVADGGSATHAEIERAMSTEALRAAIRGLDSARQTLLILKAQGHSNAEIAFVIGRTEGAVKSLYHRTLAELHEMLEADTERARAGGAPANDNGTERDVDPRRD